METSAAENPEKKKKERIEDYGRLLAVAVAVTSVLIRKLMMSQDDAEERKHVVERLKYEAVRLGLLETFAAKKPEKKKKNKGKKKKKERIFEVGSDYQDVIKKMEELELAEKKLEKSQIILFEEAPPEFSDAKYFCKRCSCFLYTVDHAYKHIEECNVFQLDELQQQLKSLPDVALTALDHYLAAVTSKQMMSQDDVKKRKDVVERLNEVFRLGLPGCTAVLYGSSVTAIGLKSRDLNVDVQYHGGMMELFKILKNSDKFTEVPEDFDAKVPRIEIKDTESDLRCLLSADNIEAVHTTRLLEIYGRIEPAVKELSMLYPLWGRLCQDDRQQDGSLPPHSFALMTIFYLQQKHGLPDLHEVLSNHDIEKLLDGADEVLRFVDREWWYHPTAPPADKQEDIEEEEVDKMVEFSDSKNAPMQLSDDVTKNKEKPLVPVKLKKCFDNVKTPSLAELWLGLLKFYFDMENLVSLPGKVTRSDRGRSCQRVLVKDPVSREWKLYESMNIEALNKFLTNFKKFVLSFHTAHTEKILKNEQKLPEAFENHKNKEDKDHGSWLIDNAHSSESKSVNHKSVKDNKKDSSTNCVVICSICNKEGHLKKNCPVEMEIKVDPLPPLTDDLRSMLDSVLLEVFESRVPTKGEVERRERYISDLSKYLRKNFNAKVRLSLFGSSRNCFTFRGSDLDISMTFDGNQTGKNLDYDKVLEELAAVLGKYVQNPVEIIKAKVRIVKFYDSKAKLEVDISLYNLLAHRNTSMIALYANIDYRFRILGYAMKELAKRCCIGDASRGSLSSYTYLNLVIYFLQQTDPPVLPVLQELDTGDKMLEEYVNRWFYNNIGNLHNVWSEFGKNGESDGELWLGMLRFYTEKFDFSRDVVSIRQERLLTAFEKKWTSKFIYIEDPFELSHNLGAGVSREMAKFIFKVFVKARERFGTEPPRENGIFISQPSEVDYFFNKDFLMDGQKVPNDRCCKNCGKIGHSDKKCPKRNGDDARQNAVDKMGRDNNI